MANNLKIQKLHKKAVLLSSEYLKAEVKLLEVLEEIDDHKVYYHFECNSLFAYCTKVLKLSESMSYNLIRVTRQSKSVPQLKDKVLSGEVSISKAARICSVLKPIKNNHNASNDEILSKRESNSISETKLSSDSSTSFQLDHSSKANEIETSNKIWLEKAMTLTSKQLEAEVAKENPKEFSLRECKRTLSNEWSSINLKFNQDELDNLEKAKSLLETKSKKVLSYTECLILMSKILSTNTIPWKRLVGPKTGKRLNLAAKDVQISHLLKKPV